MKAKHAALLFDVLLLAIVWFVSSRFDNVVTISLLVTAALLVLFQWIVFDSLPAGSQSVSVQWRIRRPHYVQAVLQLLIFIYWGLYWREVAVFAPLIVAQLILAYHFEMLLAWRRPGGVWHIGFGPFPIVFSTNLFTWFHEEYFYLQILMIAVIYLGKEFITTVRNGRRQHIINPSALALTLASLGLLLFGDPGISKGVDVVASFGLPPNFYEVVFLLGLVVQILFGTTPVTFGTAASLYLLWASSEAVFGALTSPGPFDPSVFLGLTFLVTDPSTSPRTSVGRFLFGLTYGAGIFFIRLLLLYHQEPSFYDKILMVPIVNVMVGLFDRVGTALEEQLAVGTRLLALLRQPLAFVGLYAGFFIIISPSLKMPLNFERMLLPPVGEVSNDLGKTLTSRLFCREMFPEAYRPFGFRGEMEHFDTIRTMYEQDPLVWFSRQSQPIPTLEMLKRTSDESAVRNE